VEESVGKRRKRRWMGEEMGVRRKQRRRKRKVMSSGKGREEKEDKKVGNGEWEREG